MASQLFVQNVDFLGCLRLFVVSVSKFFHELRLLEIVRFQFYAPYFVVLISSSKVVFTIIIKSQLSYIFFSKASATSYLLTILVLFSIEHHFKPENDLFLDESSNKQSGEAVDERVERDPVRDFVPSLE